jgi:hypothetical protein
VSDTELRELERRWLASHDPADEARLLAARRRTRELSRARLDIAAYVGHRPAIEALSAAAPAGDYVPWRLWRQGLDEAARAPLVSFALKVAEQTGAKTPELQATRARLRAWCACPCPEHVASVGPAPEPTLGSASFTAVSDVRVLVEAISAPLPSSRGRRDPLERVLHRLARLHARDVERAVLTPEVEAIVRWALGSAHALIPASTPVEPGTFLAERIRRGELTADRLVIAAYAGHELARSLVGAYVGHERARELIGTTTLTGPDDLSSWLLGLQAVDDAWLLRALASIVGDAFVRINLPTERPPEPAMRALLSEWQVHRRACEQLRNWADGQTSYVRGFLPRVERAFDDPALVPFADGQSHLRVTRDVMRHIATFRPPGDGLIREVAAMAQVPEMVRRTVGRWALRYEGTLRRPPSALTEQPP